MCSIVKHTTSVGLLALFLGICSIMQVSESKNLQNEITNFDSEEKSILDFEYAEPKGIEDTKSINRTPNFFTAKDNRKDLKNLVIKRRTKRSPYPPGFVIWSAPSEALPCHCSPGNRKCRCLKLMERIAHRNERRAVVLRKRRGNNL